MREVVPALGNVDLSIHSPDPFLGYWLTGFAHENLIRRAAAHMPSATAIGGDDFHFLADAAHRVVIQASLCHLRLASPRVNGSYASSVNTSKDNLRINKPSDQACVRGYVRG